MAVPLVLLGTGSALTEVTRGPPSILAHVTPEALPPLAPRWLGVPLASAPVAVDGFAAAEEACERAVGVGSV